MTREFEIPSSVAKKASDTFLQRFRHCVENPRIDLDEYRLLLWIEALGEDYEDLAEDIYMKWRKLRYRHLALPEATTNLLKNLRKQYQTAIVTNGPSQSQWEKIRELKLAEHFDCIVVSGDLQWEKPQIEIFHRVCTTLGVQPFECLIVGDKIETDIIGGLQAQLGITVWMPIDEPRQEAPTPPPDFIIRDIHQLVGILQGDKTKSKGFQRTKGKTSTSSAGSSTAGASTSVATASSAPLPSTSTKVVGATSVVSASASPPPPPPNPSSSSTSSAATVTGTLEDN